MKIAWQYEKYLEGQKKNSSSLTNFAHSFDLSKPLDAKDVEQFGPKVSKFSLEQTSSLKELYTSVEQLLDKYCAKTEGSTQPQTILRLSIESICSPLWGSIKDMNEWLIFLQSLKGLLRGALAVVLISVPSWILVPENNLFKKKLCNICDTVLSFQSFEGNQLKKSEALEEYQGFFGVKKLPSLGTLIPLQPETKNFVFSLGRRKLHIEILHLGPEGDSKSNTSNTPSSVSQLLCAPKPGSSVLDF
jgi:hypothetical protein